MSATSALSTSTSVLLVVAVGCSGDGTGDSLVTRTDSAGIEIVQSSAPAWSEGEAWQIDSVPLLSIGQVEGESAYLFGDVSGAIRIGERIAVADAQTLNIRYFDLQGIHQTTVGGAGEGPGEFGSLLQFDRCEGDHAFAFDIYDQTVQVRDFNGEMVREFRTLEPGADRPRRPYRLQCSMQSTGFVAVGWGDPAVTMAASIPATVPRNMAPVWLLDDSAQHVADLGEYLSSERVVSVNRATGRSTGSGPHPFGRATSFALGTDYVFIGAGESLAVDVFTRDGRLVRKLRGPAEDLSVSESVLADYRSATLDEAGARRRSMLEDQNFPMPTGLPAYTDMRLDPDGALWLKRFVPPWQTTNRWGVISRDGAFLGHVALPESFTLTDLGTDWVLGVATDVLGVERVRMYALRK
jgi:hypothetical protein